MELLAIVSLPNLLNGLWLRRTGAIEQWKRSVQLPRRVSKRLRWIDLYTAHDPVPIKQQLEPYAMRAVEVVNMAGLLRDHSEYRRNRHEVLPVLAEEIARCGHYADRLFPSALRRRLEHSRVRRARAVKARARWASVAGAAAFVAAALGVFTGRAVWIVVASVCLVGWAVVRRRTRRASVDPPLLGESDVAAIPSRSVVRGCWWAVALALAMEWGVLLTVGPILDEKTAPPTGRALLEQTASSCY